MKTKIISEIAKRKIDFLTTRKVVYGYTYYISLAECDIEAITDVNSDLISMIRECAEREFGCPVDIVHQQGDDAVFIIPDSTNDLVNDYIYQSFTRAGGLSGEAYALCQSETKESLLKYDVSEISADVFNEFGEEFTYDDFLAMGACDLWEDAFSAMTKSVTDLDKEPVQIESFRGPITSVIPYLSNYEENVVLSDGGQRYVVCLHCGRKTANPITQLGWQYCECCGNAMIALAFVNKYNDCPAKKRLIYKKYEDWKKENGYEDMTIKDLTDSQKAYILAQMTICETYNIRGHGMVNRISLPQNIFEIIDEDIEMAIRSFMQNMETAKGEKILVWFVANVDRMLLYEIYVPGQRKCYKRPVDAIPF